jgi:hypothetical protein
MQMSRPTNWKQRTGWLGVALAVVLLTIANGRAELAVYNKPAVPEPNRLPVAQSVA